MKPLYKAAALAALALAGLSARATTYTQGDLLIGFTAQSGNDLIYDLGQESSLFNGETWSLASLLTGYNLNTIDWGVIGDAGGTPRNVWTTTDGTLAGTVPNNTTWSALNSAAGTLIQSAGSSSSSAGDYALVDSSLSSSWNQETLNGTLTSSYQNAYENPNVVGLTSATLWAAPVNTAPTTLGTFSLDNTGTITFNAVPEPSTYALMAGAGLLFLRFRNKLSRNQI